MTVLTRHVTSMTYYKCKHANTNMNRRYTAALLHLSDTIPDTYLMAMVTTIALDLTRPSQPYKLHCTQSHV